jgi:hypothetical protein
MRLAVIIQLRSSWMSIGSMSISALMTAAAVDLNAPVAT